MYTHHNKGRRMMDKDKIPTEGEALAMIVLVMFGGTLALNIFVNLFIFS